MSNYKKQMVDGTAKRCSALARSNELFDRIQKLYPGFCPVQHLIEFAVHPLTEDNLRIKALTEIARFVYPTIKSTEISGVDPNGDSTGEVTIKFIKSKKDSDDTE